MAEEKTGRFLYKKIRYAKGRVILEWIEKINDKFRLGSIDDYNEPMDSFKNAFNLLAEDCITICELGNEYSELIKRTEVHTINIKYETEKEIPGIIISFKIKRERRSGVIAINTPYHLIKARQEGSDEQLLDEKTADKIYELIKEADYYRTGKRKQLSIQFNQTNEANENDFVVKLNMEQNGLIRPGVLISLTTLANNADLCKQNGKSGIYHINPIDKSKTKKAKNEKNIFTLKRNGNVLILNLIQEKNIDEYEKDNLNSLIVELIDKHFKEILINDFN